MKKKIVLFLLTVSLVHSYKSTLAQGAYMPIDDQTYANMERLEVKSGKLSNSFHTNLKPFERDDIGAFLDSFDTLSYIKLSKNDKVLFDNLQASNWEFLKNKIYKSNDSKKPLFKYLFQKNSDFYQVSTDDFDVHVSPIVHYSQGSSNGGDLGATKKMFINTRGIEIRGRINKKLGFYTMMADNQATSPVFFARYFESYPGIPYQSFVKIKDENFKELQADYFQAFGYISFKPIKSLTMTFGHDKNFIGSGIRSMILSDFSAPYLQLKSRLKIGRFEYLSILGQMTNLQVQNLGNSSTSFPPKYMAFHHLNVNITKKLNVGVFESVFYGKRDHGFEFNYLNPVIFYRFVEGFLGSTDNAMVGADFKLNLFKSISTYGQYVLDEYNSKEFKKDGWWSKKYTWQLGAKYYDVFKIRNLDAQIEFNRARPYSYSHFTTSTNMVNYNMPLAHPLGANFKEVIVKTSFHPIPNLQVSYIYMKALKGEDKDSLNYGGNLMLNNRYNRVGDYNNYIGQGLENTIRNWKIEASYMVYQNMFLDFGLQRRKDVYTKSKAETIMEFSVRWNISRKRFLF